MSGVQTAAFAVIAGSSEHDDLFGLFQFLWGHWVQRQRAYARLDVVAVDSGESFHFFVEPDGKGRWRIAITRQRYHALLDVVYPVLTVPPAYFVSRVPLSRREQVRFGKGSDHYKLEFKDREGRLLTVLRELSDRLLLSS
ncbi:MAG: hypothetical protein AB1898_03165 [Acidobacteriota bacterium]